LNRVSIERAREILEAHREVRALVVGDLMLDEYISGTVERISPEAPVPVVRVETESWAVGGAANVAANVLALGAACQLVGCTGDDPGAVRLRGALTDLGTGLDGVVSVADRPTTVKTRILARHQQVVRYDREVDGDVAAEVAEALAGAVVRLAPTCQVLVLEDYNKGVLVPSVVEAVLSAGREHGLVTVVDPKRLHFFGFAGCTVFKPNAKELADALGEHLRPDDAAWMEATRRRLGCRHLLLTLGERGMALATEDGTFLRIPAAARAVYDVSGAGDTVTAVVATCLAAGASPDEAAVLANHAAAIEVGKSGVATVSPDEILHHFRTFQQE
jgi:D-beta-D-heptose 7-phosphate kinase/D-beta-D-heptose 1-phosphate adenosyltransferase